MITVAVCPGGWSTLEANAENARVARLRGRQFDHAPLRRPDHAFEPGELLAFGWCEDGRPGRLLERSAVLLIGRALTPSRLISSN